MKGFTKGKGKGKKFIPTSKKKASLSSKDIRKKGSNSEPKKYTGDKCPFCKGKGDFPPTKHDPHGLKCSACNGTGDNKSRNKQTLELGKDFNIYRVWEYDSNNRGEIAVIKAKNIEDAEAYVKKTYLSPEGQKEVDTDGDGDDFSYLTLTDDPEEEIRNEIKEEMKNYDTSKLREEADELGMSYDAPDFHEDDEGITKEKLDKIEKDMVKELREDVLERKVEEALDDTEVESYGYQIEKDNEQEQEFKTIYGGNDFVDLIDPSNSGEPTAHVIGKMDAMQALGRELEKQAKERNG